MRIIFVGAVEFSRHCLMEVLGSGGHVAGVLTLEPQKASFHSDYFNLVDVASKHNVALYHIKKHK